MKEINEIKKTCYFSHTSTRRGYVSRRGPGKIIPYAGRYGSGYIHVRPRWDTTQFIYYDYYLFPEAAKN